MTSDPAILLTITWCLAAIFAAAAVTKLKALDVFAGVVANYRLLPARLVQPVAYLLPAVELGAAAALLVPATRPAGAAVIVGLLLLFAVAMAINLLRGRDEIDCGCFVALLRQRISWTLVIRNLLLAGGGAVLVLSGGAARALGGLDLVTITAGSASILLLYAVIGRLYGQAPRLKGAN